jgi:hypothetical protein
MTSTGLRTNTVYAATRNKAPKPVSSSAPETEIRKKVALLTARSSVLLEKLTKLLLIKDMFCVVLGPLWSYYSPSSQ